MRGRKPKLDPDCDALTAMAKTPADRLTFEGRHRHIKEVKGIGRRHGIKIRATAKKHQS
jgi:hypothetical protein